MPRRDGPPMLLCGHDPQTFAGIFDEPPCEECKFQADRELAAILSAETPEPEPAPHGLAGIMHSYRSSMRLGVK